MASQVMLLKRVFELLKNNEIDRLNVDYKCLEKRLFDSVFVSKAFLVEKIENSRLMRNICAERSCPKFFFQTTTTTRKLLL